MTKFSLSDILRHIITGTFLLFFIIIAVIGWRATIELFAKSGLNSALLYVLIVICYPLGIFIQSINMSLQEVWVLDKTRILYLFFGRYSIYGRCLLMQKKTGAFIPEWIKTSLRPDKIVEYMEMEIENKKSANINENAHFCEFFQGLYIASLLVIVIFLFTPIIIVLSLPVEEGISIKIMGLVAETVLFKKIIIWLIVTGFLSYLLANYYASEFIYSLDAYKEVLDINIDKYMNKFGVQRVFVMMRTKGDSAYLEEAIRSVAKQDYYNINLVILEDSKTPMLKGKICRINKEYREEKRNIHLLYYHSDCGSPAKSSYVIRDIILDIADRDDDIIFILDDDDLFAHNNVIRDVVYRMNNPDADVCLVKYSIIGEPQMNIALNGGNVHNTITTKLSDNKKRTTTIESSKYLCLASSLGWSKIYKMKILRAYLNMIKKTKTGLNKEECDKLKSYEDFPDFLVFLLDNKTGKGEKVSVTGLNEPAYLYRKHEKSATRTISREAFRQWRIDQLRLLVTTAKQNESNLILKYKDDLSNYILIKVKEIKDIIGKYNKQGLLYNYNKEDFITDIYNSELRDYLPPDGHEKVAKKEDNKEEDKIIIDEKYEALVAKYEEVLKIRSNE